MTEQLTAPDPYQLMVEASTAEGVSNDHFDTFRHNMGISWPDFVGLMELADVFGGLDDSDARHAAALTVILLSEYGPNALRVRADMEEIQEGGPIHDRPAFAAALRRVIELAEDTRQAQRSRPVPESAEAVFWQAVGAVLEAWRDLPEPPAVPVLAELYAAVAGLDRAIDEMVER